MDRDRAADVVRIAALAITGALIAALAVASLLLTLASEQDLGFGDVLIGALWFPGLALFSAGCLLRARKHLASFRASDGGSRQSA